MTNTEKLQEDFTRWMQTKHLTPDSMEVFRCYCNQLRTQVIVDYLEAKFFGAKQPKTIGEHITEPDEIHVLGHGGNDYPNKLTDGNI